jgi:chromosomal replication initiation ATPase DnaA
MQATAVSLQELIKKVAQCFKINAENLKSASKERRITDAETGI